MGNDHPIPRPTKGSEPTPADMHYLNAADLRATRRLTRELRNALPDLVRVRQSVGDDPGLCNDLVLCHRYRAYWLFVRSGLAAGKVVALAHEHGFFNRPGRRMGRLLFGRGVTLAGVSPTITEEMRRISKTALHLPNAIDPQAFECLDRATARRELGLPAEGTCIGVVGRLHYKKNPELALRAFGLFLKRHGTAHLGCIGDGALRSELQEAAAGLPVVFTGFVREPKRLMRAFDALLLTSGAQAFPNMVALEAMSAGVPVVAPNLPDAVSVLDKSGLYFDDPEPESICSALVEALSPARMSAGPERVREEFSVPAVAQRLQSLLA